jgi:hypothetical protein
MSVPAETPTGMIDVPSPVYLEMTVREPISRSI